MLPYDTCAFVPEDFQDEYQARLRDAIMKKIQGKEIVTADTSVERRILVATNSTLFYTIK